MKVGVKRLGLRFDGVGLTVQSSGFALAVRGARAQVLGFRGDDFLCYGFRFRYSIFLFLSLESRVQGSRFKV